MTRLSAVVQLIDGYRSRPAIGVAARFQLDGRTAHPLPKADAFYAFVDLAAGPHRLEIACLGYVDQELTLDVPIDLAPPHTLSEAIRTCELKPGALYAYPPEVTLIRGRVRDARSGKLLPRVSISAEYQDLRNRARVLHAMSGEDPGNGSDLGHYTIALPGRLAAQTVATLKFSRSGFRSETRQQDLRAGAPCVLDVELLPQAKTK